MNALILSAGLGTRLSPLTDFSPKPLVPVVDASIVERLEKKLREEFGEITLLANAHHLSREVEKACARLGFARVFTEEKILGTAAPLRRVFDEGFRGGLLVINGDAFCDFKFSRFVENAKKSTKDFGLFSVDFSSINTLRINEDSTLAGIVGKFGDEEKEKKRAATFAGVSYYSDEALARISENEFDIRNFWKLEIESFRAPYVEISEENFTWIDIGTPRGLKEACGARLKELSKDSWVHPKNGAAREAFAYGRSKILRSVVQEKVLIPNDTFIEDSILFDDAKIFPGEHLKNEIRGKGFSWRI